jgi:hypothetical protein
MMKSCGEEYEEGLISRGRQGVLQLSAQQWMHLHYEARLLAPQVMLERLVLVQLLSEVDVEVNEVSLEAIISFVESQRCCSQDPFEQSHVCSEATWRKLQLDKNKAHRLTFAWLLWSRRMTLQSSQHKMKLYLRHVKGH